jgi:phospholipid transport system substrate-binding protein
MPRKVVCLVFMMLLFVRPAWAGPKEAVEALLKTKVDAVLSILEEEGIDQTQKNERIMETIEPLIDFILMAKLALGRSNWSRLDMPQQEGFIDLFVKRLKASYLDKSSLYSGQQVIYKPGVLVGDKVYVPTEIVSQNKKVEVQYKFYASPDGWRVYDVEIDGVSLVKSYRSQFNEILSSGTVEDLFKELEKASAE